MDGDASLLPPSGGLDAESSKAKGALIKTQTISHIRKHFDRYASLSRMLMTHLMPKLYHRHNELRHSLKKLLFLKRGSMVPCWLQPPKKLVSQLLFGLKASEITLGNGAVWHQLGNKEDQNVLQTKNRWS